MPHIKKHPEYNKRKTRRIKLRKDDYEHGVDRARKIIDSGNKDKKIILFNEDKCKLYASL